MKLLFDESVPRPLGAHFPPSFEIRTVQRMGWSGRSNGDLLRLAASHGFDGFVTADRGIEYQQNLENLPFAGSSCSSRPGLACRNCDRSSTR